MPGCHPEGMRVRAEELTAIRKKVAKPDLRYTGLSLDGASIDADYGLEEAGFRVQRTKRTGDLSQMVLYECRPDWPNATTDEVAQRLEHAWVTRGAFKHEAHVLAAEEELVVLDFVTWWDSGTFYTGRIEAKLGATRREGP